MFRKYLVKICGISLLMAGLTADAVLSRQMKQKSVILHIRSFEEPRHRKSKDNDRGKENGGF